MSVSKKTKSADLILKDEIKAIKSIAKKSNSSNKQKSPADSRKLLHENAMLEGCIIITSSKKAYVIVANGQEYDVTADDGYSAKYPNIIIAMKATGSHIEANEGYDK